MIEKNNKKQDEIDESIELSYEEKLQGQLDCLKEMNKILKGAIERHETNRNNN
jgi:uncharacterized protein YjgD (DUF1641 family)